MEYKYPQTLVDFLTEQEVLSKLRIGSFQRQCEWTKESLINECSNLLWTILDYCSFKKLL